MRNCFRRDASGFPLVNYLPVAPVHEPECQLVNHGVLVQLDSVDTEPMDACDALTARSEGVRREHVNGVGVAQDRPLPRWTATMNASSMVSFANTCLGGRPAGCRLRLQVQHLGCVPRRCPSRQNTSRAGFFGGGACPSVGLGGCNRRAASHAERARLNVTRAIRATMANLARDNPSLGRHLAATIRTGRYCSYTPIRTRRSPGSVDPGPSAEHPCTPNERRRSRKDPSWEGAVVPVDGPLGEWPQCSSMSGLKAANAAGTAAVEGGDPLRFDGWLELLRVVSELVAADTVSRTDSGTAERADERKSGADRS
jgi:hypothetical protein